VRTSHVRFSTADGELLNVALDDLSPRPRGSIQSER
jgi:hypothetical protein